MKLVKLPPEAQQAVEDAGEKEDEGKEVAEELEVAVKHFEVRSTRWEVRSGKDGLRITNYELSGFESGKFPAFYAETGERGRRKESYEWAA